MTEPRPGAEDPRLIVRQLESELDDIGGEHLRDDPTDAERWGASLAGQSITYPAAIQAAADLCVPTAEVTTSARKRFIDAADRALAARRARTGLLPVALAAARRNAGLSLSEVQATAAAAGFTADIADLESGRRTVRDAGPAGAAAWIFAVQTDRADALASYRRSLEADNEGELRPAAGAQPASSSVDDLVAQVVAALDELEES